MLPCEKRQKLVKKGEESLRCINRSCEAFGHTVNEVVCEHCPVRVMLHPGPPCNKKSRPPKPDCDAVTDEAFLKALAEAKDPERLTIEADETPDGVAPEYPQFSLQLWLYKEALMRWHRAGRPTRTDEEVNKLLEICQKCDWYDPSQKRCKGCGCRVTDGGMAVTNKLRMATEKCPYPNPKW